MLLALLTVLSDERRQVSMQPQGNQNADHEGYELFRRAIDERDEQAWAESAELWRIASSVAETAQQQCVLLSSYVYGLSPQAILKRHPGLFADATEIYKTKRNLLSRLKRCPEIRQFYQEWLDT
jgi:hypothetical protein